MNPTGRDKPEAAVRRARGRRDHSLRPLALMSLVGEFGGDPLGAGFGSFDHPVDVEESVLSAIPLPASLLLLLSGIGGLSVIRLTRRQNWSIF